MAVFDLPAYYVAELPVEAAALPAPVLRADYATADELRASYDPVLEVAIEDE